MIMFTTTSGATYISFPLVSVGGYFYNAKTINALAPTTPHAHGIDPRDVFDTFVAIFP